VLTLILLGLTLQGHDLLFPFGSKEWEFVVQRIADSQFIGGAVQSIIPLLDPVLQKSKARFQSYVSKPFWRWCFPLSLLFSDFEKCAFCFHYFFQILKNVLSAFITFLKM